MKITYSNVFKNLCDFNIFLFVSLVAYLNFNLSAFHHILVQVTDTFYTYEFQNSKCSPHKSCSNWMWWSARTLLPILFAPSIQFSVCVILWFVHNLWNSFIIPKKKIHENENKKQRYHNHGKKIVWPLIWWHRDKKKFKDERKRHEKTKHHRHRSKMRKKYLLDDVYISTPYIGCSW